MDERCPVCGKTASPERYTVDRLGVRHWFRQCPHCGHRWAVQRLEPWEDNPFLRTPTHGWRPDKSWPRFR